MNNVERFMWAYVDNEPKFATGQWGLTRWFVKNDDPKLLETIAVSSLAIATFAAAVTIAAPGVVVGPLVMAVSLIFAALTSAAGFGKREAHLLMNNTKFC